MQIVTKLFEIRLSFPPLIGSFLFPQTTFYVLSLAAFLVMVFGDGFSPRHVIFALKEKEEEEDDALDLL